MATIATPSLPVVIQSGDGKVFQFPGDAEARRFETAAQTAGGETLRLVPATPPAAKPLYDLETHLAHLIDTENVVPKNWSRNTRSSCTLHCWQPPKSAIGWASSWRTWNLKSPWPMPR
jgi:hypothetical protein